MPRAPLFSVFSFFSPPSPLSRIALRERGAAAAGSGAVGRAPWGPAPVGSGTHPGAAALGGFALSVPAAKDGTRGRERGSAAPELLSDSLGRGCAYRISILAIPLGINYAFRTRGYSDVKIVYLQLGELEAEAGERAAPLCPAALRPRGTLLPRRGRGDGSARLRRCGSVPGRARGSPAPADLFLPRFSRGNGGRPPPRRGVGVKGQPGAAFC